MPAADDISDGPPEGPPEQPEEVSAEETLRRIVEDHDSEPDQEEAPPSRMDSATPPRPTDTAGGDYDMQRNPLLDDVLVSIRRKLAGREAPSSHRRGPGPCLEAGASATASCHGRRDSRAPAEAAPWCASLGSRARPETGRRLAVISPQERGLLGDCRKRPLRARDFRASCNLPGVSQATASTVHVHSEWREARHQPGTSLDCS